ncbi:MAG: hypothetical protein BWY65_02373 [Firmicutes bacterium ADurb.Bin373]|nr:MAG: hypothetical protein BWY65_02373 [Firmicutes bacterium ADurb.Bin373]
MSGKKHADKYAYVGSVPAFLHIDANYNAYFDAHAACFTGPDIG